MFGYVRANLDDLTEEEKRRYHACYCGLCHALGERFGNACRMTLTYDMTFLALFLSSLYEPEESTHQMHCILHPKGLKEYVSSEMINYAADMTIVLSYYKCLDDWQDDHNLAAKSMASKLKKHGQAIQEMYPRQCAAIEQKLQELREMEGDPAQLPESAGSCFGQLMAELFVYREDFWQNSLRQFGLHLGKFVYWMDAVDDYQKDQKQGTYNPLVRMNKRPEEIREILMMELGEASAVLERLPLVQDANILRNVLYSGVWQSYNQKYKENGEMQHGE